MLRRFRCVQIFLARSNQPRTLEIYRRQHDVVGSPYLMGHPVDADNDNTGVGSWPNNRLQLVNRGSEYHYHRHRCLLPPCHSRRTRLGRGAPPGHRLPGNFRSGVQERTPFPTTNCRKLYQKTFSFISRAVCEKPSRCGRADRVDRVDQNLLPPTRGGKYRSIRIAKESKDPRSYKETKYVACL